MLLVVLIVARLRRAGLEIKPGAGSWVLFRDRRPTTAEFPKPVDIDHNSFPIVAPPEPVEDDMSDEGGGTVKKKRSWGWDYLSLQLQKKYLRG